MAADQREEKSQLHRDGAISANAVTLVSMDGDSFVVETSAILVSQLIKVMVDEAVRNPTDCVMLFTLSSWLPPFDGTNACTAGSSGDDAKEIPLPNMRSNVLAKVVEFCNHHYVEPMKTIPKPIQYGLGVADHVQEWYADFASGLDDEMLFELLLAANYLDLAPLLEICAATVGLRAMNKTPEEVAREFNLTEPFSPEVEKKLREENKWSTEPPVSR